ncbi:hypothetical protein EXS57_03670 [Candidatus Kaiserbacteria bacterium]|nr:hypothetical protein [Candidatus Kaiserbacteria bacterium]
MLPSMTRDTTKEYQEAQAIIRTLGSGRYFCECPCGCGEEINLKDAGLFYDTDFTSGGIEARDLMIEEWRKARANLKSKRLHKAAHTQSVNIGFISEKMITTLEDFTAKGYRHADCRSIFQPIDFLIFKGLSEKRVVSEIFFAEVKSGSARLNTDQKEIREVINNHGVEFKTF